MRKGPAIRWTIEIVSGLMILGPTALGFLAAHGEIAPRPAPAAVAQAAPAEPSAGPSQPAAQPVRDIGSTHQTQAPRQPNTAPSQNPTAQASNESVSAIPPCDKPDGIGLSRVVQIDTTGGPEFGRQHFNGYDFLRDKEVVLTFDDGPAPRSTPLVLQALADTCLKATFFEIGEQANLHPEITRQVIEAGMTVGTHTWSHKDLARNPYAMDGESAAAEIELGNSAVRWAAAGEQIAPFFRFPELQNSALPVSYLAQRNIAIFSTDIDSRDFAMHKPQPVVDSVMSQLDKRGKGIILLHDLHLNTAKAMPELLQRLKTGGYKVVHLVPKDSLTTLPKYDDMFGQMASRAGHNGTRQSAVVRTIAR